MLSKVQYVERMKYTDGQPTSIWLATTPSPNYSRLKPGLEVDVAILGGGFAGLQTAYQLQQKGKTVAVIEAEQIVKGVSGQTTAHITSEHNLLYDYLLQKFGLDQATLYAQANETAISELERCISQLHIECDFKRLNQQLITEVKSDADTLRQEFEAAKSLGLPVTYQTQAQYSFPTYGCITYQRQAQFHPRKYLLQLASHLIKRGGLIFEHTRATKVTEGEPCVIETDQGELRATDVVMATHFPFMDNGGYFARMKVERSYVLGVYLDEAPIPDMYDNTFNPYHYVRTQPTSEGMLVLIGGEDHPTGQEGDTEKHYQALEEYARSHFKIKQFAYRWSSQDNYPHDKVPFIGRYTAGSLHHYVATGFQGYGMTHSVIASLLLSDMIVGNDNPWESLYSPQRFKPLAQIPSFIKENVHVAQEFLGGRLSAEHKKNISDLVPGRGTVVDIEGQKIAVYKDENGQVFSVSAVCQHLGCIVNFNSAERTWDCPCHGSRFAPDGKILHGPTVKKLPQRTLSTSATVEEQTDGKHKQ